MAIPSIRSKPTDFGGTIVIRIADDFAGRPDAVSQLEDAVDRLGDAAHS